MKTFHQPKPEIQTTSLWDFPSQHYGDTKQGSGDYIGVTPSYVIWNLLQRYTKPGDLVLDPMCGSGTTLDVAKDLGRRSIGFDIAPSRPDVQKADARKLPLDGESVDFVFLDPPYSTHIKYSGDPNCIGELDAREGGYYEAMEEVIAGLYKVMKPGAYLGLYISDSFAKGKSFSPLGFEIFLRLSRLFDPVDIICVTRHHKTLKRNHWHTSALEGNYFLRGFNYLFIMRKQPFSAEQRFKHEGASWLSPLFQAATKARPGEVITPQIFSELLADDALSEHLSKKKQKKLRPREDEPERPRAKERDDRPQAKAGSGKPAKPKHFGKKKKPQGRASHESRQTPRKHP